MYRQWNEIEDIGMVSNHIHDMGEVMLRSSPSSVQSTIACVFTALMNDRSRNIHCNVNML